MRDKNDKSSLELPGFEPYRHPQGRKPINGKPMSSTERVRRHRARQKSKL